MFRRTMASVENSLNVAAKRKSPKIDPSFKSKRYRDKLRTEVKALENLIPVNRPALNRKLDSQTVYRIVIAYLKIKSYFKALKCLAPQAGADSNVESTKTPQTKDERDVPQDDTETQNSIPNIGRNLEQLKLEQLHFEQALDGFVLLLSVDGTIMFVSENISHYLGFNQVDLIHRCFYGILLPGDQSLVRDVLENHGDFSYQPAEYRLVKPAKNPKKEQETSNSTPISFLCRMKSYTKKSSGYTTFHCVGKTKDVADMFRSNHTSSRVVTLYCRPYLLNDTATSHKTNQDLTWSKHDLDLKFNNVENRESGLLGYHDDELCGTSLYQLVHPDDLCLLVQAHRTIIDVNTVQTFYLRLQDKAGDWVWLYCKGKVISKNSKKFSIVLTHKTLREEDSVFIEHETLLRKKYSSQNLMALSKPLSSVKNRRMTTFGFLQNARPYDSVGQLTCLPWRPTHLPITSDCSIDHEITGHFGHTEFYSGICPSTWHINSGRHSPVVPSSQIAHKGAYEKNKYRTDRKSCPNQQPEFLYCNGNQNVWRPNSSINSFTCPVFPKADCFSPNNRTLVTNTGNNVVPLVTDSCDGKFCYFGRFVSKPYNYPPSPPPSPHTHGAGHWDISQSTGVSGDFRNNNYDATGMDQQCTVLNTCLPGNFPQNYNSRIQSCASVKVSMVYNSDIKPYVNECSDLHKPVPCRLDMSRFGLQNKTSTHNASLPPQPIRNIKTDQNTLQSCAWSNDFQRQSRECKQHDIEASVHMKIVETQGKSECLATEVCLPGSTSFMDYLAS